MYTIEHDGITIEIPAYGIDGYAVMESMRALASADPDRVYGRIGGGSDGCSNVDSSDRPGTGCIVGEALIGLGVSREILAAMEACTYGEYPAGVSGTDSTSILTWLWIRVPKIVADWIRHAQSAQDTGSSWARAIERADRDFPITSDND
jgi:hypothetical protein